MRLKIYIMLLAFVALMSSCGADGSSSKNTSNAASAEFGSSETEAIEAAQNFIRLEYANDAIFQDNGTIVEPTEVPDRYKVLQRFDSESKDGYNFVYRIWVQKFPTGWEYGNLGIERAGGERVLTLNGRMKEKERNQGVGDKITAGGIEFTVAEQKPTVVRVYTPNKLTREQLKAAILELTETYQDVQFATDAKHERGDEYASWTSGMFFDYDKDEIISRKNFFK